MYFAARSKSPFKFPKSPTSEPKILVMLSAYFDASYTERGKPLVVIGGCVARASRWKTFQVEWQEMLDQEGLQFFHMTDCGAYQGPYTNWNKEKHDHFMKKVTAIISRRIELAVSRAVLVEDFDWALPKNRNLTGYNSFTFCAIQSLQGIAQWANRHNIEGPIAYIFEGGDGQDHELLALKNHIEESEDRMRLFRWSGLHIVPKIMNDKVPPFPLTPLQAADVWAFEIRKEMENFHIPGQPLREFRRSTNALMQGAGEEDCGFLTRDILMGIEVYNS